MQAVWVGPEPAPFGPRPSLRRLVERPIRRPRLVGAPTIPPGNASADHRQIHVPAFTNQLTDRARAPILVPPIDPDLFAANEARDFLLRPGQKRLPGLRGVDPCQRDALWSRAGEDIAGVMIDDLDRFPGDGLGVGRGYEQQG
jgi:hypothetical protein